LAIRFLSLPQRILNNPNFFFSDNRTIILQSGELQISDVTMEDGFHSYRCVALHTLTDAIVTSDPASIVVIGNHCSLFPAIRGGV
jgi:hypothetical protein